MQTDLLSKINNSNKGISLKMMKNKKITNYNEIKTILNQANIKEGINVKTILTEILLDSINNPNLKGVRYSFIEANIFDPYGRKQPNYEIVFENNFTWLSVLFSHGCLFAEKILNECFISTDSHCQTYFGKDLIEEFSLRVVKDIIYNQRMKLLHLLLNVSSEDLTSVSYKYREFILNDDKRERSIDFYVNVDNVHNIVESKVHSKQFNNPQRNGEKINMFYHLVKLFILKMIVFQTRYLIERYQYKSVCFDSFFDEIVELSQDPSKSKNEILSDFTYRCFVDSIKYHEFSLESFVLFESSQKPLDLSFLTGQFKSKREDTSTIEKQRKDREESYSMVYYKGFSFENEGDSVISEIKSNLMSNGGLDLKNKIESFQRHQPKGKLLSVMTFDKIPHKHSGNIVGGAKSGIIPVSMPYNFDTSESRKNINMQQIYNNIFVDNQIPIAVPKESDLEKDIYKTIISDNKDFLPNENVKNHQENNKNIEHKKSLHFEESSNIMKHTYLEGQKAASELSNQHRSLFSRRINPSSFDLSKSMQRLNKNFFNGALVEGVDYIIFEFDPNLLFQSNRDGTSMLTTKRAKVPLINYQDENENQTMKDEGCTLPSITDNDPNSYIKRMMKSKQKTFHLHDLSHLPCISQNNRQTILMIPKETLVNIHNGIMPLLVEKSLVSNLPFSSTPKLLQTNFDVGVLPMEAKQKEDNSECISENKKQKLDNIQIEKNCMTNSSQKDLDRIRHSPKYFYSIEESDNKKTQTQDLNSIESTLLLKVSTVPVSLKNFLSANVFRSQMFIKSVFSRLFNGKKEIYNNSLSNTTESYKSFSSLYHWSFNSKSYFTDFFQNSHFIDSLVCSGEEKRKHFSISNFSKLLEIQRDDKYNRLLDSSTSNGGLLVRFKQLGYLQVIELFLKVDQQKQQKESSCEETLFNLLSEPYHTVEIGKASNLNSSAIYLYKVVFSCKEERPKKQDILEKLSKRLESNIKMPEIIDDLLSKIYSGNGEILSNKEFKKKAAKDIVHSTNLCFLYEPFSSNITEKGFLDILSIDLDNTFKKAVVIKEKSNTKYQKRDSIERTDSPLYKALEVILTCEQPMFINQKDKKRFVEIIDNSNISEEEKVIVTKILYPVTKPDFIDVETSNNTNFDFQDDSQSQQSENPLTVKDQREDNTENKTSIPKMKKSTFLKSQYLYSAIVGGCDHTIDEKVNFEISNNKNGSDVPPVLLYNKYFENQGEDPISKIKSLCEICIAKFPKKFSKYREIPPDDFINLNYNLIHTFLKKKSKTTNDKLPDLYSLFVEENLFSIDKELHPLFLTFEPVFMDPRREHFKHHATYMEITIDRAKISAKFFLLSLVIFSKGISDQDKVELLSKIFILDEKTNNHNISKKQSNTKSVTTTPQSQLNQKVIVEMDTSLFNSKAINTDELLVIDEETKKNTFPIMIMPFSYSYRENNIYREKLIKIMKDSFTGYFLNTQAIVRRMCVFTSRNEKKQRMIYNSEAKQSPLSFSKKDLVSFANNAHHKALLSSNNNHKEREKEINVFFKNCDSVETSIEIEENLHLLLLNKLQRNDGIGLRLLISSLIYLEHIKTNLFDRIKKSLLITDPKKIKSLSKEQGSLKKERFKISIPREPFHRDFQKQISRNVCFFNKVINSIDHKEPDFPLSIQMKKIDYLGEVTIKEKKIFDSINYSELFPIYDALPFNGDTLEKCKSSDCYTIEKMYINFSKDSDWIITTNKLKSPNINSSQQNKENKLSNKDNSNWLFSIDKDIVDLFVLSGQQTIQSNQQLGQQVGITETKQKTDSINKKTSLFFPRSLHSRVFLSFLSESPKIQISFPRKKYISN